jgi:hypothetical protein
MAAMNSTMSASTRECRLEVTVSESQGSLVIVYRFFNNSPRNGYLFNKQCANVGNDGVYRTQRDLLNVEVLHREVIVSKKIVPVPPDLDVEKPNIPCVTLVRGRTQFEETIRVKLPLKPYTPYAKPRDTDLAASPVSLPLAFELGYFVAPRESDSQAREARTSDGPALRFDPFPVGSQSILRVGPFDSLVPVRLIK